MDFLSSQQQTGAEPDGCNVSNQSHAQNTDILELQNLLAQEKACRLELQEERDILLIENRRLHDEIAVLKIGTSSKQQATAFGKDCHEQSTIAVGNGRVLYNDSIQDTSEESLFEDAVLFEESAEDAFANSVLLTIKDACGGKNVIHAILLSSGAGSNDGAEDVILCGGADGALSCYDTVVGLLLWTLLLGAPVLLIEPAPLPPPPSPPSRKENDSSVGHLGVRTVACGLMDGSVVLVRPKSSPDIYGVPGTSKRPILINT